MQTSNPNSGSANGTLTPPVGKPPAFLLKQEQTPNSGAGNGTLTRPVGKPTKPQQQYQKQM